MREFTVLFIKVALDLVRSRARLELELLALRQQLAVLQRTESARGKIRRADRVFWVLLRWIWPGWRRALTIVTPDAVVAWHRKGFRLFWAIKSRHQHQPPGRPPIGPEIVALIKRMCADNRRWGSRRIRNELRFLGHDVAQSTVLKYIRRFRPVDDGARQRWKTFLYNHMPQTWAMDFMVVPTVDFKLLYVLIILCHERRTVVHFNVTENPTSAWVANQLTEAVGYDLGPRYLIRDNDSIFLGDCVRRIRALGIEDSPTAPQAPWQNPYAERVIGSVRRECLDFLIILGRRHLLRILTAYFEYYHRDRPHLGLADDSPDPRRVQPPHLGDVIAFPVLGGLHHRYERRAA